MTELGDDQGKDMSSPRRRRWFKVCVVIATPPLAFVCLEIVFRIAGIGGDLPLPRSSRGNAALVDTTRNRMGIREPWDTVPGDASTMRIAFLGDSFTFGTSVEQDQCFVHLVEKMINSDRRNAVVTINMGEPGTDPAEQVAVYERLRELVQPDVVVHVLYCNDLGHDLYDDLVRIHALQDRRSFAADHSYVWRYFERRVRYDRVLQQTLDYFRGGDSPFKRRQAWQRLENGVRKVRRLVEEDGATYVIVMFPWLASLDDYPLTDVHDRVRHLASDIGVPFLDLLDTFRGRDASRMRISIIDEHPSVEAHRLTATAITRFLQNDVLK